ncbi:MAG: cytochrome c1 [Alcanivorax sp.]|nr:cytochrome c1 [Alcanivorax sp.]
MMRLLLVLLCALPLLTQAAEEGGADLKKAPVNLQDKVSLQHGAKLFVNYCMGCHSLKYMRYNRMAKDLEMPQDLVQKYLNFTSEKPGAQMANGLSRQDGKAFFGKAPPDLTMETRLRSPDWVYSYLTGFYKDDSRPYGYNNHVFPSVAMPNVVAKLESELGEKEFQQAMGDITNFLTYTAEPMRPYRESLGVKVLAFLALLFVPAYLLKREYWKDVH